MDGGTGVKRGEHFVDRTFEHSHNIGDKFALALDGSECVELVGADINGFFHIGSLKSGKSSFLVGLKNVLDKFSRTRKPYEGAYS